MERSLERKVVAVSGGFGCLGLAVAQALIARGAHVALLDKESAPKPGVLPPRLMEAYLVGDVDLSSFQSAQTALGAVVNRMGRLDAMVNLAGGFRWETLIDGSSDTWDLMFTMNLKTAVNASKAALQYLPRDGGGRIVNVSAGAASKGAFGMGPYSAAKAGVARFTEALAEEVKDKDITVNAVLPSIIDTPQNRSDMPDADFARWVKPAQVGDVIAFLLTSEADAVTGALIPVSGRV